MVRGVRDRYQRTLLMTLLGPPHSSSAIRTNGVTYVWLMLEDDVKPRIGESVAEMVPGDLLKLCSSRIITPRSSARQYQVHLHQSARLHTVMQVTIDALREGCVRDIARTTARCYGSETARAWITRGLLSWHTMVG